MTGRKISLAPYMSIEPVPVRDAEGNLTGAMEHQPFDVCNSLVQLLFVPALQLDSVVAVKHNLIAAKLLEAGEGDVLLTEEEWKALKSGVAAHKGWTRNQTPLIALVNGAEEVEAVEKEDTPEADSPFSPEVTEQIEETAAAGKKLADKLK